MTDFLNLHALDELVAAATPGPWEARRYSESGHRLSSWSRIDTERHDIADEIDRHADAVAIVALRNAYPGLRSLIDRLTEDRATLVQQNRELTDEIGRLRRVKLEAESLVAWDWLDMLKDCHDANDVRRDVQRLEAALYGEETT